jgi:hypothetical protein
MVQETACGNQLKKQHINKSSQIKNFRTKVCLFKFVFLTVRFWKNMCKEILAVQVLSCLTAPVLNYNITLGLRYKWVDTRRVGLLPDQCLAI